MDKIRKIATKSEMIEKLETGKVFLPPLTFRLLKDEPQTGGTLRFDEMLEASWGENIAIFAVECRSLSTPKVFQDGLNRLKTSSLQKDCLPILFVPFLGEQQLMELERAGISGIDLCGNGIVVARPNLLSSAAVKITASQPLLRLRISIGKTVLWSGGFFSFAPATNQFRMSTQR